MRILFFTQYFWPENFRINELVEYYDNKNNTILTSYPNYPNFKKFKFYKTIHDNEYLKSKIFRMLVLPRSASNFSIILNYISFIILSFFYSLFVLFNRKIDMIFIFCPSPILSAIPIIFINKFFKKKITLWVLDLWPDTIVDLNIIKNKFIINFFKKTIKYIYKNCDLILAQSESIKNEINKISTTKCVYFPSWPEEKIFDEKLDSKVEDDLKKNHDCLRIMFTGNIGEAQSFDTLIDTALILKNTLKIKWLIIGDGRWKKILKNKINQNNLNDDIKLFDSVPITKMNSYYEYADALYLSLKNNSTFKKTIPGKLQTYMSSGKPIIASISGEAHNLIIDAKCGFVSEAEDHEELANNIKKFASLSIEKKKEFGNNALNYSNKFFNKKKIFKNLENELRIIL